MLEIRFKLLWANFASLPGYLHKQLFSFFFYNFWELQGDCMGMLESPLAFPSRINSSLILSLSS